MTIERFTISALRHFGGAVLGVALLCAPAAAQSTVPLLIEADWLAQHVNDRDLVVLHVGPRPGFDAGHISGARYITEEDVSTPHDHSKMTSELMLELPAPELLRSKFAALGISDASRIVVYAGSDGAVQSATRIIFTLDYLGLGGRTSLLNGGLTAWQRAGQPVTAAVPPVVRGSLSARPPQPIVADAALVASIGQRPNYKLIDARGAVFYRGIEATMNGKSGHIPGAINIPFSDITDNLQLIDRARVSALFRAAGVNADDTIVAYCHVGQQATAVVFAARLAGYHVMLYDGSFQDWAINDRGPVVK